MVLPIRLVSFPLQFSPDTSHIRNVHYPTTIASIPPSAHNIYLNRKTVPVYAYVKINAYFHLFIYLHYPVFSFPIDSFRRMNGHVIHQRSKSRKQAQLWRFRRDIFTTSLCPPPRIIADACATTAFMNTSLEQRYQNNKAGTTLQR